MKGKPLLYYKEFTYSKMGVSKSRNAAVKWVCSSRVSKSCKAFLMATVDGVVQYSFEEHSHSPPNMFVTGSGKVIRV